MRRPLALAVAGAAASVAAFSVYRFVVDPWRRTWGTNPDEAGRLLPGDELIASPSGVETRAITILAPEAAVWPWLVQMGFGRAGWYSYDAIDIRGKSADRIVPEWQAIAVGDTMPTHPGGGFRVVQVEPDHALVLYLDDSMVGSEAASADVPSGETAPPGLAVSGAILGTNLRKFRATWSFVLEPIDGMSTRLIERCRIEVPQAGALDTVTGSLFGFGVFVMMRRQLLGLKERAERLVNDGPPAPATEELPAPAGRQELVPE
ncbi:MAG TPA: hypothetical protein VFO50_04580 [Candidatus Limnocylindrales bacterium]|nr:hypothetical protein [Candidatus Limnocylindrales bacterium]